MSLFDRWYKLELDDGFSQAEILRKLNQACGTSYKSNWVAQVQSGTQGLSRTPPEVRRFMMARVLRYHLEKLGITDEKILKKILNDLL